MSTKIYLAIPYRWNPEESFKIACEVAADLMRQGFIVFSPISHSHFIGDFLDEKLRLDGLFWLKQDLPILSLCDELYTVIIGDKGEDLILNSEGCQIEIQKAKELNLPITKYYFEQL